MAKNDFLSPKAAANRIKAKGLQKLRCYCQMCQKQCRDENGFKCHCMSESHQRQMEVFGQNPHRIVEGFSEEFETTFLDHMKRSHRFSRIAATVAYNEYINDRHHVHMTSTQWATLTEFVKYLGRTGKCKIEDTPKGWFMAYIDRDSETFFKEKMKNKRAWADIEDEERQEREIQCQIELAKQTMAPPPLEDKLVGKRPLVKSEGGEKIRFTVGGGTSSSKTIIKEKSVFEEEEDREKGRENGRSEMRLIKQQEKEKERKS